MDEEVKTCIGYREFENKHLRGFFEFYINLETSKIKLKSYTVLKREEAEWVFLIDYKCKNKGSKIDYRKGITFSDRKDLEKFIEQIQEALIRRLKRKTEPLNS